MWSKRWPMPAKPKINEAPENADKYFVSFIGDEQGASATEYALFVMLIAVAILAGVRAFGIGLAELYTNNSAQVVNALP